ncbi:MAG: SLC13 family permease [Halieaceae bacterium]|nr:SLC13 family permease [Halieaceae bacterium]RPG91822.1 MAG: SLC13 family permease [Cellvibrionales bacterium TMED157]
MDTFYAGAILTALLVGLVFSRLSATVLFLMAAIGCLIAGLIEPDAFWAKATNEGLVTLMLLMLCAVALERLPWLGLLSRRIDSPNRYLAVARITAVAASTSAFLNNTAIVAALAQVLRRSRYHLPSQLLLPLSYAAILGGTLTLIGTSTNLIVSSFLADRRGNGLAFFDFLWVAGPVVLVVGLLLVVLSSRLPKRVVAEEEQGEYVLEAVVEREGGLVGRTVRDAGLRELETLYLSEIIRGSQVITAVAPGEVLQGGDRLNFVGDIKDASRLTQISGLTTFASEEGLMQPSLTEVIVAPGSILNGRTPKELGFRARFDAAIVGLQRDGETVSGKLGRTALRPGDLLVLATGEDFAQRKNLGRNFYLLSDDLDVRLLDSKQGFLVTLALGAVIAMAATGSLSLSVGLLGLLMGLWLSGLVSVDDLRRRFPFDIWILVASALVLAQSLVGSELISTFMSLVLPVMMDQTPLIGLVVVFLLTLMLTELVTNNAAAALMFPIGYGLAESLGVDVMPFVLAVAFAASGSFLTPYGYATNLIVQNIGGYTRGDYLRFGLPISVAYSVGILTMLCVTYF